MQRSDRVSDEIRRILADLFQNNIKDPRLPAMVSIVSVEASRDLSHAKVYISIMGDDKERAGAEEAIKSASGYLRREMAARMRLRVTPELHFIVDNSIERGIRLTKLIDDVLE